MIGVALTQLKGDTPSPNVASSRPSSDTHRRIVLINEQCSVVSAEMRPEHTWSRQQFTQRLQPAAPSGTHSTAARCMPVTSPEYAKRTSTQLTHTDLAWSLEPDAHGVGAPARELPPRVRVAWHRRQLACRRHIRRCAAKVGARRRHRHRPPFDAPSVSVLLHERLIARQQVPQPARATS